jgi:hypothetical protein
VPEIVAWAVPIWNLNVTTRLVGKVRAVLDEFVADRTLTRDGDRYQKAWRPAECNPCPVPVVIDAAAARARAGGPDRIGGTRRRCARNPV